MAPSYKKYNSLVTLAIFRPGVGLSQYDLTSVCRIRPYATTVEPLFNEVAGDRPNLFVKWRVRYIEVLFHTFYCNFGRDIEIISFVISRTSLNRGSLNRGSTVLAQ